MHAHVRISCTREHSNAASRLDCSSRIVPAMMKSTTLLFLLSCSTSFIQVHVSIHKQLTLL